VRVDPGEIVQLLEAVAELRSIDGLRAPLRRLACATADLLEDALLHCDVDELFDCDRPPASPALELVVKLRFRLPFEDLVAAIGALADQRFFRSGSD
jgi:hypothetical protein